MISLDYLKYTPCQQQADQFYYRSMILFYVYGYPIQGEPDFFCG